MSVSSRKVVYFFLVDSITRWIGYVREKNLSNRSISVLSALFMDIRACVTLYIRPLFRENTRVQQLCESYRCFSSEENLKRVFGFPPKLHRGGREKCKNFYEKRVQLSVFNLKKKKSIMFHSRTIVNRYGRGISNGSL